MSYLYFYAVKTTTDGLLLQDDPTRLLPWSAKWGPHTEPVNCKSLTMTLRRAPVRSTI